MFWRFVSYVLAAAAIALYSCSSEQNTIAGAFFHNTTAKFNGHFYAKESTAQAEQTLLKSVDDDPNFILRLFPRLDTTKAKGYSKDTDEAIKMASISIQRHPRSKWTDDNYLLVGIARLYACDFLNATLTFKYVNTKSKDPHLRHLALIWLVRTYTEKGDFEKAVEAVQYTESENLSPEEQKRLLLEKAHYYQVRGDLDNMVQSLSKADPLLRKQDRRGRIYFIIGQVYQHLGFNAQAYNYYQKTLHVSPEYEIDFYARLNMAQVAEIKNPAATRLVRKQFQKMLHDAKNKEFLDKIYYELGWFEQKQGRLKEAVWNYKMAVKLKLNTRIQAVSYLRIGQIHFDSLKKYALAKPYYDSAMTILPKDFENYEAIKARQLILDDFVKYSNAIAMNDSLLLLAEMDTSEVRQKITAELKLKIPKTAAVKKKRRVGGMASGGLGNAPAGFNTNSTGSADWYFANPSAVALGQNEFKRIWGNTGLEDNWRRSGRNSTVSEGTNEANTSPGEPTAATQKEPPSAEESREQKIARETSDFLKKLPRTEPEKQKLLAEIEDALFKLGDLYFFNLNERDNAIQSLESLLKRFPNSKLAAETLFKLHRIYADKDKGKADFYAAELQRRFPRSPFARSLINPDYWKDDLKLIAKQKEHYETAYNAYLANELHKAKEKIDEGLQLGESEFYPQLQLLNVLLIGRTNKPEVYQGALSEWIKQYPEENLKPYAETLMAAARTATEKLQKAKDIAYTAAPNEVHLFIAAHLASDKLTYDVSNAIERFNRSQWGTLKLKTSNLGTDDGRVFTIVTEFPDAKTATQYYDQYLQGVKKKISKGINKIHTFVITKSNFDLMYKTQGLDEYLTFFDRTY